LLDLRGRHHARKAGGFVQFAGLDGGLTAGLLLFLTLTNLGSKRCQSRPL